jgi:negative regulator of flagellin synthesis FlgM
MKIWGDIPKISGVYDKQKSIKKLDKSSETYAKHDAVSISNQAKDYQTVMKALRDVPDIRKDKVDELRDKYESGKLNVSGNEIIDKLVKPFKE